MTEQSREEFEKWFKREFHPDKTGPYIKDIMFFTWKASRKAVVIGVPAYQDDVDYDQAILACRQAIKAQGLTVK